MDPPEAERDAISSLLRPYAGGGSLLQPQVYSDDPRHDYSEDSLSDEGGHIPDYYDVDDPNDSPFAISSSSPSSSSREPPKSIWDNAANRRGLAEGGIPPRGGYSDDPEGGRVADGFDGGGGGSSVGMVGTRPAHRFGGIVAAAARRKRGIFSAACLLLALAFGCGIVYVKFYGGGGDGGGGGVGVEGNSAGDSTEAGGGGGSDGYDYVIADDEIIGGEVGSDQEEEEEEEEEGAIEEGGPGTTENPTEAPIRDIETDMAWWSAHWCGSCTWNHFTSCDARKAFLMSHYGNTELVAMEGIREYCALDTQAPSVSIRPSSMPTGYPTEAPSVSTRPSSMPSENPTVAPSSETAKVWWSAHWCGNCTWNHFTSCDERKAFLMRHYGITELKAMEGTREYCAIASQAPSVSSRPSSMPTLEPSASGSPLSMPGVSPTETNASSDQPYLGPSLSAGPTSQPSGRPSVWLKPTTSKPTKKNILH